MSDSLLRRTTACAALLTAFVLLQISESPTAQQGSVETVIVECEGPCGDVAAVIGALGGEVTHLYDNVDALAARLPAAARRELATMPGVGALHKDAVVAAPRPLEPVVLPVAEQVDLVDASTLVARASGLPDNYIYNNVLTGAVDLFLDGVVGAGVLVAVIDSGTADNPAVVPALAGSVIGGENFVPGDPYTATSTLNDPHGTWVGGMIAAHADFLFLNTSTLVQSLGTHAPGSVIPDFPVPGISLVPMFGTAPLASLYAQKVFPSRGGGAPESRIIAAMDRAITLRRNYNNGVPPTPVNAPCGAATPVPEDTPCVFDALPIEVVNMSLGGPTLFAGRDLEDQLTVEMLDVGIVLVTSAGNEGHAAMTGGSPGTGRGSLTTGAANTAVHERVLRDLQFGLGIGSFYRASDHTQTAFFSSRGPTADGRIDPDVVANGFASFTQGANGGLSLVSGTSFSSPTVAGAAALLREAVPAASAVQIRNALIETANPTIVGDDSAPIDQGAGFIDIPAARAALESGSVSSTLDRGHRRHHDDDSSDDDSSEDDRSADDGRRRVSRNVTTNVRGAGFDVVELGRRGFSTRVSSLRPGQVAPPFFFRSRKETDALIITVRNISPALPPGQQNAFFGDDVFLKVQDAVTSDESDPFGGGLFIAGDTTVQFDHPQEGVVRIAVMGDWTNAGEVSADLVVDAVRSRQPKRSAKGRVAQSEQDVVEVDVPVGTTELVFELSWRNNWSAYPTDDLDLVLTDPFGGVNVDGATLDRLERVVIDNPLDGIWSAVIGGFTVHGVHGGPQDRWELRVTDQDGRRLRAR